MPQTDINLFFNQIFFLILVFFLLLTFFSTKFFKQMSRNLSFRMFTNDNFLIWNYRFQTWSINFEYCYKVYYAEVLRVYEAQLIKTNVYSRSLLSYFLSSQDNLNLENFDNITAALTSDYNLKNFDFDADSE